MCSRALYSSAGWACGRYNYARVFTGTVKSAVEVGDTDKRLQLIPDEVFLGSGRKHTAGDLTLTGLFDRGTISASFWPVLYPKRRKESNALASTCPPS